MKEDSVYLRHILDSVRKIRNYTSGGKEAFFKDPLIQDGVIRNLEIIGEATKNLSQKLRDSEDHIPWKLMAGMRDKLIHEYFGVNMPLIWNVVELEIAKLEGKIEVF